MNNVIFLWVNNYRLIDDINGERKFLFNDCGINLSSKFNISHEWISQDVPHENAQLREKRLCIKIKENKSKVLFDYNEDEVPFYSKCITDLKIIVGKNGVGKSSLLDILSKIVSGNLRKDPYLQYFLLCQTDKTHFTYTTNLFIEPQCQSKNRELKFDRRFIKEDVYLYSAAFKDEWNYDYPLGGYSHIHDLTTQFLLHQDIENYNNNLNMYGSNSKLWCHASMDSIRQINFVTAFLKKESFLKDIFHLPSRVTFFFSEGHIKNAIRQLLEDLEKKGTIGLHRKKNDQNVFDYSDYLNERDAKKSNIIERAWVKYFKNITDLKLKISLAAALSLFRTYHNHPNQIENVSFIIDDEPNDEKCLKFIESINFKYDVQLKNNVVNKIYEDLSSALYSEIDDTYTFQLISQLDSVKHLLENIYKLGGHTPIMEMYWGTPLSSGESNYIKLFSRLYDEILKVKRYKNKDEIESLFLIDEVDLYFHPEWQRMWFSKFLKGLEIMQDVSGIKLKFHLIITTHSPFIITDYFNQNIVKIHRDDGNSSCHIVPTEGNCFLAGNIYDILEKAFFLKGSMGYFVESKLRSLVKKANGRCNAKIKLSSSDRFLFDNIGDPVMKSLVYQRLKDKYDLY